MNLFYMRKFIAKSLAGKSWLSKWLTLRKVKNMTEREVMATYYLLTDKEAAK